MGGAARRRARRRRAGWSDAMNGQRRGLAGCAPFCICRCSARDAAHGSNNPRSPFTNSAKRSSVRLIETNTTGSTGNTTDRREQLAARFRTPALPRPTFRSSVRRRRIATSSCAIAASRRAQKPILLLAHLDVVEAKREDWTYDPFMLTEHDGYFYGRGTQDQKGGAATLVTTLLRLKAEKFVPIAT